VQILFSAFSVSYERIVELENQHFLRCYGSTIDKTPKLHLRCPWLSARSAWGRGGVNLFNLSGATTDMGLHAQIPNSKYDPCRDGMTCNDGAVASSVERDRGRFKPTHIFLFLRHPLGPGTTGEPAKDGWRRGPRKHVPVEAHSGRSHNDGNGIGRMTDGHALASTWAVELRSQRRKNKFFNLLLTLDHCAVG
jgi:hypothetical protein